MKADASIFKAYDIRGIYPDQIDDDGAYAIGRAFAAELSKGADARRLRVAVGADMRLSSPALKARLIEGILDGGIDIEDIGLVSTPTFYFAVADGGYDGGVQVSASHNPKEWNGFKLVRDRAIPISMDTGIAAMRDAIAAGSFNEATPPDERGTLTRKEDILAEQLAAQMKDVKDAGMRLPIKRFKIAIDTANGMGAPEMKALFAKIPCDIHWMNDELDGTFPAHPADPLVEANTAAIRKTVVDQECDIGIATDGDGDRYFLFDEKGDAVPLEILRGIMSQIELKERPGSTVAYDIRPGKITKDMIDAVGGKSIVTPVGHSLIKARMLREDAIFGGESSGHFFYKLPYGTFEAPLVLVIKFLQFLTKEDKPLSEVVAPYKIYFNSGEINTRLKDRESGLAKIEEIKAAYADGTQNLIDGLAVEYPDYWFVLRLSNTEPLIRLIVEARSRGLMEEKRDELLARITEGKAELAVGH
jgi:phosphomannomutase